MSKHKHNIIKRIVSSGDYGMVPAGTPLYEEPTSNCSGDLYYNVSPGQLVAYKVQAGMGVPVAIDSTSLTPEDLPKIRIGVGVDTDGDGVTNSIRHLGAEHIEGCNLKGATVEAPQCGKPMIKDFLFDCVQCEESYGVTVSVDDNLSRSWGPIFASDRDFTAVYNTDCSSCSDCPVEVNCKEIACGLANGLNGNLQKVLKGYPDFKAKDLPRPFFATRLHPNSFKYCISPQTKECSCNECDHIDALTTITVNGVTIDLTGVTNPNDNTQTLIAALDRVVNQINKAFETEIGPHSGSAYLTGSYNDCCDLELHVNTCDAGFDIAGLTPCEVTNPLAPDYPIENDCVDCTDTPESKTYSCGIRIIAERLKGECNCYLEQPLAAYYRKIDINAHGDSWRTGSTRVECIQELKIPTGFGSWIQWLEYRDGIAGGCGRNYRNTNPRSGWLGLPDSTSRVRNAVTADCKKSYCTYNLNSHLEKEFAGVFGVNKLHSAVHIPTTDAMTKASWEAFFNNMLSLAPGCVSLGPVSCD